MYLYNQAKTIIKFRLVEQDFVLIAIKVIIEKSRGEVSLMEQETIENVS